MWNPIKNGDFVFIASVSSMCFQLAHINTNKTTPTNICIALLLSNHRINPGTRERADANLETFLFAPNCLFRFSS